MYTLIVIDMQDTFVNRDSDYYAQCIDNVAKKIIKAKANGRNIIMVEFDGESVRKKITYSKIGSTSYPTIASYKKLLNGYNRSLYVFKNQPDGAWPIIDSMKANHITSRTLKVCGVYASHCVSETVKTLARNLPETKIYLLTDSIVCYQGNHENKLRALQDMKFYPNVRVVGKEPKNSLSK